MNKQQWVLAAILVLAAMCARAQTVAYIHTDALGSPVAVTNASGVVIERTVYEPYGAVINRPVTNGPGYTGHVMDEVTGLNYMQQRYYDPQLGRFLSNDPVTVTSAASNFNRYWYANNNPYAYVDPDGRCTGSILVNKDGTCRSTGGFTFDVWGLADGMVTGARGSEYDDLAAVTPTFTDEEGNPLSVHNSLGEALQAGEAAAEAARIASGTQNEYGTATVAGHMTSDGTQTYYNSAPVTSNSTSGIAWRVTGHMRLVALNHSHPNDNGFSRRDMATYRTLRTRWGEFQGVFMFDGRGNHWYGPSRPVFWVFRTRTHSCGGATASAWSCPSFGPNWRY